MYDELGIVLPAAVSAHTGRRRGLPPLQPYLHQMVLHVHRLTLKPLIGVS